MKIQFRVQENPLKTLHLFFVCGKKYFAIFFDSQFGQKNIRSQKCCICYLHRKNTHICLCTQAQLLFPGHFPKYFTGINAHIWYLSWQGFIHVPVILALVFSTVLWERKNHVIYSIFREINSAKIFVKLISWKNQ